MICFHQKHVTLNDNYIWYSVYLIYNNTSGFTLSIYLSSTMMLVFQLKNAGKVEMMRYVLADLIMAVLLRYTAVITSMLYLRNHLNSNSSEPFISSPTLVFTFIITSCSWVSRCGCRVNAATNQSVQQLRQFF